MTAPTLDLNLYSRKVLADPEAANAAIRAAGPAVWLPRNKLYAIGRYVDVKATLKNDKAFSSAHGIAANPITNRLSTNTVLCSDTPEHAARRKVLLGSLAPRNIEFLTDTLQQAADRLVKDLLARECFDGVADFASALPIEVIADLVGIEVPRQRLLRWGNDVFDALGPLRRLVRGGPSALTLKLYSGRLTGAKVVPGSWAASVFDAADRGDITRAEAQTMVIDFVVPSLDTTILSSAHLLWRLATTDGLLETLRADPSLINAAVVESVRLSSPVRTFTRYVLSDVDVDGVQIPAGSRVAVLYAAANSDPSRFPNPARFDLTRPPADQLGWGHGPHTCVGLPLAKLEMAALVRALLSQASRIEVGTPTPMRNSTLQGFTSMPARLFT